MSGGHERSSRRVHYEPVQALETDEDVPLESNSSSLTAARVEGRNSEEAQGQEVAVEESREPSLTFEAPPPLTERRQGLSSQAGLFIPGGRDGVFSNMAAKPVPLDDAGKMAPNAALSPNGPDSEPPQDLPPMYSEVLLAERPSEPVPPYAEETLVSSIVENGDLLIDGLPVGTAAQFFVTLFISALFDFVGYFMTSILATSHASRQGSRAGLGATLIRIGLLLKYKSDQEEFPTGPGLSHHEVIRRQAEWISVIFIAAGAFIMAKANGEFIRVCYLRRLLLSSPEFVL